MKRGPATPTDTLARRSFRQALKAGACVAVVVALLGGLATDIGPWYAGLKKPPWQPPDYAFGPVWTLIYIFSVWSAAVAWCARWDPAWRRSFLLLWGLNVLLNIGWSVLFFRLQRPDWALVESVLLWLSIAALAVASYRAKPKAAWLLLPYLAWVTIATVLNRDVVALNAPFGG